MSTMVHVTTLVETSCWCGVAHAIPRELMTQARENGTAVYCPLGHQWVFSETTQKELDEERRRHAATRDLLDAEERSHNSTKGHLTRQKKRASAGVCPCCNRTFQQLARHMSAKHPGYVDGVKKA